MHTLGVKPSGFVVDVVLKLTPKINKITSTLPFVNIIENAKKVVGVMFILFKWAEVR